MTAHYAARRSAPALDEPGAAPGRDAPRWPGAPEPELDEDGRVVNAVAACHACSEPSTLGYRCSECGADLASNTDGAGNNDGGGMT